MAGQRDAYMAEAAELRTAIRQELKIEDAKAKTLPALKSGDQRAISGPSQ